jgi:hypothetical protein
MRIDYNKIMKIEFECTSSDISELTFESYMADAKIGNKSFIQRQLAIFCPLWAMRFSMDENNYRYQITSTHIIVPYERKQHFFKYSF